MNTILESLLQLLRALLARDCAPDPLVSFTTREWADLPATHPLVEGDCGCAC